MISLDDNILLHVTDVIDYYISTLLEQYIFPPQQIILSILMHCML